MFFFLLSLNCIIYQRLSPHKKNVEPIFPESGLILNITNNFGLQFWKIECLGEFPLIELVTQMNFLLFSRYNKNPRNFAINKCPFQSDGTRISHGCISCIHRDSRSQLRGERRGQSREAQGRRGAGSILRAEAGRAGEEERRLLRRRQAQLGGPRVRGDSRLPELHVQVQHHREGRESQGAAG